MVTLSILACDLCLLKEDWHNVQVFWGKALKHLSCKISDLIQIIVFVRQGWQIQEDSTSLVLIWHFLRMMHH